MKSVVTTVIASADAAGRFPSTSDLESVQGSIQRAAARLEAAEKLVANLDTVAKEAYDACIKKYPYLNNAGEANSNDTFKAKCARDIGYYIRMVTYCLVVGGTGPMDDYLLGGLAEINRTFELSPSWYIEALKYVKANHGLSGDPAVEANSYLDYAINALS